MGLAKSVPAKALLLGLVTALTGWLVTIIPLGRYLEEQIGLEWLFTLRGPHPRPSTVAVVAMERESADYLSLLGVLPVGLRAPAFCDLCLQRLCSLDGGLCNQWC